MQIIAHHIRNFENSAPPIVWQQQYSGVNTMLMGISYNTSTGVCMVVGENGVVITSTDMENWTVKTSPTSNVLTGAAFADLGARKRHCVVNETGNIYRTDNDGTTWVAETHIYQSSYAHIRHLNGNFVATGSPRLSYSPTGTSYSSTVMNSSIQDVAYGASKYVVVAPNSIEYSSNLTSWTTITTNESLASITYGNGVFVAVGSSDYAWVSTDGVTWAQYPHGLVSQHLPSVCFVNGMFIAVSFAGDIITSENGIVWNSDISDAWSFSRVSFTDTHAIAVGVGGTIYTRELT